MIYDVVTVQDRVFLVIMKFNIHVQWLRLWRTNTSLLRSGICLRDCLSQRSLTRIFSGDEYAWGKGMLFNPPSIPMASFPVVLDGDIGRHFLREYRCPWSDQLAGTVPICVLWISVLFYIPWANTQFYLPRKAIFTDLSWESIIQWWFPNKA